jgi:hypothetical protein
MKCKLVSYLISNAWMALCPVVTVPILQIRASLFAYTLGGLLVYVPLSFLCLSTDYIDFQSNTLFHTA